MHYEKRNAVAAVAVLVVLLAGCGGGGGGGTASAGGGTATGVGTVITGTVSAPGGTVAFNPPTGLRRMLAGLFGGTAYAALSGLNPVSGATVQLIEINSVGAQVSVIASATTDSSGVYSLTAPEGFVPASNFIIRALGTGSNRLDALTTGTTVNVDPATDATRALVLDAIAENATTLAFVSTAEILDIQQIVENKVTEKEVDPNLLSATALSTALETATQNNEETNNRVNSTAGQGTITGTVTGPGQPQDITIVVRDFGNFVTRAVTRTDALGQYTVNVPPGDYIVGALNETTTNGGASEWWTSGGGAVKQLDAEKITVGAAPIIRDFVLELGGRIGGTVTAETGGAPLPGIGIKVRDFLNNQSVAEVKTAEDGTYGINLAPGVYYLIAENTTTQPYATEVYNPDLNGGASFGEAARLVVTLGDAFTNDFSLLEGRKLSGLVSDPTTGPVPGMRVRFDDVDEGDHATVQRTNRVGAYRIWLRPGVYKILSRGQSSVVDATSADQIQNFDAPVLEVKMILQDGDGNPVSQAKARLRDAVDLGIISKESSNSDGTVSVYSSTPSTSTSDNRILEIKIDNGQMIGSIVYINATRLSSGALVPLEASINDLGTILLPPGGILSGTVTVGGVPQGNVTVQVRNGGPGNGARFVKTSTQIDGSYSISLPAGTYSRICAYVGSSGSVCPNTVTPSSGTDFTFVDDVVITANSTTILDFDVNTPP